MSEHTRAKVSVEQVLEVLQLEQAGETTFTGNSVGSEGPVIFAGQLIGQFIAAAAAVCPGKHVTSAHSTFARAGKLETPVEFVVDTLHEGRSLASVSVTAQQGERRLARSLLLLGNDEPDLAQHCSDAPSVPGPDELESLHPLQGWEQRKIGDADIMSVDHVGPAEQVFWSRFDAEGASTEVPQALVNWASVAAFLGASVLPHEGLGLSRAHRDISTGVLSHTVFFHRPFDPSEWALYNVQSTFTGAGRAFGRAEVFGGGQLIASITQESMLRPLTGGVL
ncbi:acyl-CoA thioesterase [Enemella dayhoffiae]|uniref:acyl-CoA thioesterase n=1 Tax=Enemella dayhoffiae TaxID=2016507 RepID=UPI001595B937|nr:acyl-CoA thioesterase domain-containing protein [Enemella dayhoffiae]